MNRSITTLAATLAMAAALAGCGKKEAPPAATPEPAPAAAPEAAPAASTDPAAPMPEAPAADPAAPPAAANTTDRPQGGGEKL